MKKLTITFLIVLGSFSLASAETLKISLGAMGNLGMLAADGEEHAYVARATIKNQVEKRSEDMVFGAGQIFAEVHLPYAVRLGLSYVPYSIESETTTRKNTHMAYAGEADITQKVQIDIDDMTTLYLSFHHAINDEQSVFIKAGLIQADLITNEVLSTNSVYGNTTLDGQTASIGYEHSLPNGFFVRGAADYTVFDDASLNSTGDNANANKVLIRNMEGPSGTFSIGRNF